MKNRVTVAWMKRISFQKISVDLAAVNMKRYRQLVVTADIQNNERLFDYP
jgi:hypothetical protein